MVAFLFVLASFDTDDPGSPNAGRARGTHLARNLRRRLRAAARSPGLSPANADISWAGEVPNLRPDRESKRPTRPPARARFDPVRANPVTSDRVTGLSVDSLGGGEVTPRVSVVVPVYNPGSYIEPAIASILGQTMAPGEVEAIFVDDGSTDGTSARLDRLAAEHPDTVRVIHIAPSGSPGRPRNLGIEAARGQYIQFLDADDELALDALERLVAMADRNHSDIVVGRYVSGSVPRPQRLFDRNVERCSLDDYPRLMESSLGPTKLFRRAFVLDQAIAFPEGWRIMEDLYFSLQAYVRARVISVVAEHTCYFFHGRDDRANLSFQPLDADRHFANLRSIIDMVVAETQPGPIRDRILRRLLRTEVLAKLNRLGDPDLLEDDRARLFAGARAILADAFDTTVVVGLGAIDRDRIELLREDRPGELVVLVSRLRDLGLATVLETVRWRAGRLEVGAAASLVFLSDGRPFVVVRRGERSFLDPAIADELVGRPLDVTSEAGRLSANFVLRAQASAMEWDLTASAVTTSLSRDASALPHRMAGETTEIPVRVTAVANIDLGHVGAGAFPVGAGTWEVLIGLHGFGIGRSAPLLTSQVDDMQAAFLPALVGDPGRVVVPIVDAAGLRLEVDPPPAVLADALAGRPVRVVRDGDRLVLDLAFVAGPGAAPLPAELVIRVPDGDRILAARLRVRFEGVVLEARVTDLEDLASGQHPILLRLGDATDWAEVVLGTASIDGRSRLRVLDLERLTVPERIGVAARSGISRGMLTLYRRLLALYRRLPARSRRSLRAIARQFR